MSAPIAGYPVELERPRIESVNSRRGLTTQIDCTDWRDTLNGTRMNEKHEARFWASVAPTGFCWEWTGAVTFGYGRFHFNYRRLMAHRVAYELLVGEIAEGKVIDHLCRNTICVNPDHMEVVSVRENWIRSYNPASVNAKKTVCKHGHPLSGKNLRMRPNGERTCKECVRIRMAGYRAARRAAALREEAGQ